MRLILESMRIVIALIAFVSVLACSPPPESTPPIADCGFLSGDFTPPLDAETCTRDPGLCARTLNSCLVSLDFRESGLWLLKAPQGAVPVPANATSVRVLASGQTTTPMHGRFNTVFLNEKAALAFNEQILRDPQGHFDTAELPYGSVIVKHNFTTQETPTTAADKQLEGEPWLTVMAKIEGYCAPTVGGNCVGGEWFYYLYRFGDFKQFNEVPVYGKPQAFCTDCHNPVAKADFLWNLHLYVRGRETPVIADGTAPTDSATITPPPSVLCAGGDLGITPVPPPDVPFAPSVLTENDRQAMFDCFSWRTFAALNWPVKSDARGEPDIGATLANLGPARVWESYKETAEVFQPQDRGWTIDDQEWNDRQFIPEICQESIANLPDSERMKVLQWITKTRSHQVLNETHQAMGNQFNILVDQTGKLVHYEVRFNRDEFEYFKAHGLANTGNYSFAGPKNFDVFFPTNANGFTGLGAIEIKAAWRELCVVEDNGQCLDGGVGERYYTQLGLIYTPQTRQSEESCRLAKVGLVGLHVIRKTEHAPQWVWSTFEHVDNVPRFGQPGEPGRQYLLNDPSCEAPSDEFCSRMRPGVLPHAPAANKNCCPNAQLIHNANPGQLAADGSLQPKPGEELIKNQITRLVAVGPAAMNARFQAALPAPWSNYFLLNTQWPSGARQTADQPEPGAARRIPCNVRKLLWSPGSAFVNAGIPEPPCYTMQPRDGSSELKLRNTTMETFQATWNAAGTPAAAQASSQSCFNCHGFSGVDFSFAWTDATEEIVPFPPPPTTVP